MDPIKCVVNPNSTNCLLERPYILYSPVRSVHIQTGSITEYFYSGINYDDRENLSKKVVNSNM